MSPLDQVPQIQRFRIEELAGFGSMGKVYRAIDRTTGDRVALKTLHGLGEEDRVRLAREAEILADIAHPSVVRYVTHGDSNGEAYLAMEWLDGETLQDRLKRGCLSVEEAVAIARDVAAALGSAHERGVVHRDVKPSNLFLVDRDATRTKLTDFGIARDGRRAALTLTGVLMGTPRYMAPEQARGERIITGAADVHALGSVIFRCLAGRTPFDAVDVLEILVQVVTAEAPRFADVDIAVPRALDDLVAAMLAKDPKRRPSAVEVARLLSSFDVARASIPPPALPRQALTSSEQAVRCLAVARVENALLFDLAPLRAEIARAFAALDVLADGSLLACADGRAPALDQALRAARAGVAMRRALPQARIAVVAARRSSTGNLGATSKALELLNALDGPGILVDDTIQKLLGDRFDLIPTSRGTVLAGEGSAPLLERTLLGRRAPFVGRAAELARLEALFATSARDRTARAVIVKGVAGVGKSRLRDVFLERVRSNSVSHAVWIGRGDPMRARSPFGMVAQALKSGMGALEHEPAAARQARLATFVAARVAEPDARRVTEFLGELVGASNETPSPQLAAARRDARLFVDQVERAFQDLLRGQTRNAPLVVVLDDLHWADRPSVELVRSALEVLTGAPLFVFALARPEVDALPFDLGAAERVDPISLGVLTPTASEELVSEMLGSDIDPDLTARILERADGNAFFLEELVRAVADGHGRELPETVLAVLQSRLDALDDAPRRVLRAASVFGRHFWQGAVVALLGGSTASAATETHLGELERRELATPRPSARHAREREFVFRHVLVRDAAYASLTDEDRALGHRLAAAWLEEVGELDADVIAGHYECGGDLTHAATWYRTAAEQALECNDFPNAIDRARRAANFTEDIELRASAHLIEAEAHMWLGPVEEAQRCAIQAFDLLSPGAAHFCDAAAAVVRGSSRTGDAVNVARAGSALLECADIAAPNDWVRAAATCVPGSLLCLGREATLPLFERLETVCTSMELDAETSRKFLDARWWMASFNGELGASMALGTELLRRAEDVSDLRAAAMIGINIGSELNSVGDFEGAEKVLRRALANTAGLRLPSVHAIALHNLGYSLALQGQRKEGLELEVQSVALLHTLGETRLVTSAELCLARMHLLLGDPASALAAAKNALAGNIYKLRPVCEAVISLAELELGRVVDALASANRAASLLEPAGFDPDGWSYVPLALARALEATGDIAGAREVLVQARAKLEHAGSRLADAAARRRFFHAVPENAALLELAKNLGV